MADNEDTEVLRLRHTVWIATAGLVVSLAALIAILVAFGNNEDAGKVVPAVLAPVLAVIGTLVGAVAGHAAGSASAAGGQLQRKRLEQLRAYEAALPDETRAVREDRSDLF